MPWPPAHRLRPQRRQERPQRGGDGEAPLPGDTALAGAEGVHVQALVEAQEPAADDVAVQAEVAGDPPTPPHERDRAAELGRYALDALPLTPPGR